MPKQMRKVQAGLRLAVRAGERLHSWAAPRRSLGYIGSLGDGNLGDLACFLAARRLLAPWRLVPAALAWDERRLAAIGLPASRTLASVIVGGGTMINYHRVPILRHLVEQGCMLHILGSGAGACSVPDARDASLLEWRAFAPRIGHIGVRGEESKRNLESIGFKNVKVVGDLALALTSNAPPHPAGTGRIGLALAMPEAGTYGEGLHCRFAEIEAVVKTLASRGLSVVPIFIEPRDQVPYNRMRQNTRVLPAGRYASSLASTLDKMRGCSAMISIRLHGAVLAATLGIPTVLLSYGPKCDEFHRSIDRSEFTAPLGSVERSWLLDRVLTCAAIDAKDRTEIWSRSLAFRKRLQEFSSLIVKELTIP